MNLSKSDRKKFRIRNKVKKVSSNERLRLSVSRSTRNISAQIIDDAKKITLVSATSNTKEIKLKKISKKELSVIVAEQLAKKAKDMNWERIDWNFKNGKKYWICWKISSYKQNN